MAQPSRASSFIKAAKRVLGMSPTMPDSLNEEGQASLSERLPDGGMSRQGSIFHRAEWEGLVSPTTAASDRRNAPPSIDAIQQALMPTAKNSARQARDNDALFALTPELSQARRILVSSILSPNDVQTGMASVVCEDETLTPEHRQEIGKLLTNYFNGKLKLGAKLSEWLGDVLFKYGAKAIVVAPKAGLRNLVAAGKKTSKESLTFTELLNDSEESNLPDEMRHSFRVSLEGWHANLEAQGVLTGTASGKPEPNDFLNKVVDHSYSYVSGLFKEAGAHVPEVTTDVSTLKKSAASQRTERDKLIKDHFANLFGLNQNNSGTNAWLLDEDITKLTDGDEPFIIELPPSSVIPVCIKGSVSTHIAYFVLIDENGDPIEPHEEDANMSSYTSHTLVRQAMNAYTSTQTGGGIWNVTSKMTEKSKQECLSSVFNVAVKHIMQQGLKRHGIVSVDVSPYNAISNSIFFNMLAKHKVRLLYIPEPMMIYYAFDHRADGTGKSLIEGIEYVLSLRSTLYIAYIMSVIQSAMIHRTVEVDVDEKNLQVEQVIEMVRELVIAKDILPFDNNPTNISRHLAARNCSIYPKSVKGLPGGLNVKRDESLGRVAPLNPDILAQFNNMWMAGVSIPPSAFNALGEHEYARSIAVSHLYFSNDIRVYQGKLEDPNARLIRNYVAASSELRKQIGLIISPDETEEKSAEDMAKKVASKQPGDASVNAKADDKTKDLNRRVASAILSLRIALPQPNISMSKAQFEELTAFIDSLDKVIMSNISDDAFADAGPEVQNTVKAYRAMIKSTLVRQYIARMGLRVYDIPATADIIRQNDTVMVDMMKAMVNLRAQFRMHSEMLNNLTSGVAPGGEGGTGGGGQFGGMPAGAEEQTLQAAALDQLPSPPRF